MIHFLQDFGNVFAFSGIIAIYFMSPLIGDGKRFKKIGTVSLIIYFVSLVMSTIALLFLIPSISDIYNTLSIYILARTMSFGDFIQRIDAVFILMWVMLIFNYLAITMYFILKAFKKITNIKNEKSMTYCFSALLFTISLIPKDVSDIIFFESTFYKYCSIALVFFISFLILICGYFKKKRQLKKGELTFEKTS